MLQVAIHGDDVFATRVVKTSGKCRRLAEVSSQAYHRDPAVHARDLAEQMEGFIGGAIVHEHDLEALATAFHDGFQSVVEIRDILLLVVQGYDDGISRHKRQLYGLLPLTREVKALL